jgi:hypothetical protein
MNLDFMRQSQGLQEGSLSKNTLKGRSVERTGRFKPNAGVKLEPINQAFHLRG